jgi:hypothetical protein
VDVVSRTTASPEAALSESRLATRGLIQDGSQTTWMAAGKGRLDQCTQRCMPVQLADSVESAGGIGYTCR